MQDGAGLEVRGLSAWFGAHRAVADVDLTVAAHSITALIGPSGCGKSTVIRSINRMHELVPGARVAGEVIFDGVNVYDAQIDPMVVRQAIGMVFQRPNPFPTKSIYDNVVVGLRLAVSRMRRSQLDDAVERALTRVALWDEVSNRLQVPATGLSGGQQQRLCIARAIVTEPKLLLMDEPCAALDPIATLRIEELIRELKELYTVIIVTHNMQQATRVSDHTAFFNLRAVGEPGRLVEFGTTRQIFDVPRETETEAYVTGRMG